jgi:hypothetical protein
MATQSQHPEDSVPACQGGGGQIIVDLCDIREGGLVFWSRQRFEIGAELQMRIRRDALGAVPGHLSEWVTVRGFVVECPAMRRRDGSHAFRISLLLDSALVPWPASARHTAGCPRIAHRFSGLTAPGLN